MDTRLVLTNAVYFNAAWASQFEKDFTVDGTFIKADGAEVTTPTMNQENALGYADLEYYQVIRMSYEGKVLEMVERGRAAGRGAPGSTQPFAHVRAVFGGFEISPPPAPPPSAVWSEQRRSGF